MSRKNNSFLEPLIQALTQIHEHDASVAMTSPIRLDQMLPDNYDYFYKYQGSLTTPPCSEAVTWVLFSEVVGIGQKQVRSGQRLTFCDPFRDLL